MFLICLKKTLVFFTLFLFFTAFLGLQAESQDSQKPKISLEYLLNEYLLESTPKAKKAGTATAETKKTIYIAIKDECEKYKAEATACCSNPNACSGLMRDLAENTLPLLPALYSTFASYRTSKSAGSGNLSAEQVATKMCNVKNNVSLGVFSSRLLSQLGESMKATCKDRIGECEQKCNAEINIFREDFKIYFAPLIPDPHNSSVESIINFAKECAQIEENTEYEVTLDDIETNYTEGLCYITSGTIRNLAERSCSISCPDCNKTQIKCVEKKTIGYILLFATAYKNSSKKKQELSEESNEQEIVQCSNQPKRVLTQRKGSNGPVPAPVVDVCRQFVRDQFNAPPRSPSPAPGSSIQAGTDGDGTSALTGGTTNPLLLPEKKKKYGVLGDDTPEPSKKPSLNPKPPGWAPSPGSGRSSPSGGGPGGGGDAPSLSSGRGEGPGYPYRSYNSGEGSDSFSGGYGYNSLAGGDDRTAFLGRDTASEAKEDSFNLGEKFELTEDSKENDGKSIFQNASHRIQQFCSDHSCSK